MLKKINIDTHILIRNGFTREQIIKILHNCNSETQFLEIVKKKIKQMNTKEVFISLGGLVKQITKKDNLDILKIIKNELDKQDIKNEKIKSMLEIEYRLTSTVLNNFFTKDIKIDNFHIKNNILFLNNNKFIPLKKNISDNQKDCLLFELSQNLDIDKKNYFLNTFFDYIDEKNLDETFLINLSEFNKLKNKNKETNLDNLENIVIYSNPNLNTKHLDNVLFNLEDIDVEQISEMADCLIEEELQQQNKEYYLNNHYQRK
ncbi:hypothetical protein [Campylobacter sp. RM12651]|uniref:hypothetical protein n=1 Tax=Campylobacter sp. RM12651 TaxID=1660079 RepID=UPI001EFBB957|nr:hypothetical protein [Campylobacter sp. RM12651]ULO04586.1 hypothetical protein AVBRAN_a0104 [Campylobacter sp. RM12651]